MRRSGDDTDGADQPAGAHAGGNAVAFELEQQGGKRTANGGGQGGRDPDLRLAADVAHLQHGGAESLGDQASPTVGTEGHDGKADHLSAATDRRSTAGQTANADHSAYRRAGNGERQDHADDDGNDDAHPEGGVGCGSVDKVAKIKHGTGDVGADQAGQQHGGQDGNEGRDEDVQLGLFGNQHTEFNRHDDGKEATAGAGDQLCRVRGGEHDGSIVADDLHRFGMDEKTNGVASRADDGRGIHDQGGGVHCPRHADADGGADHKVVFADRGDHPKKLLDGIVGNVAAECSDDGTDEKRGKQTLGHTAHGVDEITFAVLFQFFFHGKVPFAFFDRAGFYDLSIAQPCRQNKRKNGKTWRKRGGRFCRI